MDIKRSGSQPSGKGPAEYFTGAVRVEGLAGPALGLIAGSAGFASVFLVSSLVVLSSSASALRLLDRRGVE
jgi:hypothetical protein